MRGTKIKNIVIEFKLNLVGLKFSFENFYSSLLLYQVRPH